MRVIASTVVAAAFGVASASRPAAGQTSAWGDWHHPSAGDLGQDPVHKHVVGVQGILAMSGLFFDNEELKKM